MTTITFSNEKDFLLVLKQIDNILALYVNKIEKDIEFEVSQEWDDICKALRTISLNYRKHSFSVDTVNNNFLNFLQEVAEKVLETENHNKVLNQINTIRKEEEN